MSYWIKPSVSCLVQNTSNGTLISGLLLKRKWNVLLHQLVESNAGTDISR